MGKRARAALAAVGSLLVGGSASAGLLSSPPPALDDGSPATVIYRMGAVHYEPGGWVDTTVTCTNLAAEPATLILEVFDESDRLAGQPARVTAAAGASVTFATSVEAAPNAVTIPGLPALDHGKARLSASTKQLACTALNRMRSAEGTVKEASLELLKKVAY